MDLCGFKARIWSSSPVSSDKKLIVPATIVFILALTLYASVCLLARNELRALDAPPPSHAHELVLLSGGSNVSTPSLVHGRQFYTAGKARYLNVRHRDIDWSASMTPPSWFSGERYEIPLLVHFAHHKTGTAWFSRVFQLFALHSKKTFVSGGMEACDGHVHICQVGGEV